MSVKRVLKPILSKPQIAKRVSRALLTLDNWLDRWINELIVFAESGVHPKHRLMNYHQFFVDHVAPTDRVLDVGCGRGMVANDVAKKAKKVVGIELDPKNVAFAKEHYQRPNLSYVIGDALKDIPPGEFDVIVLSNVLEHIDQRVSFASSLKNLAPKVLIRVPMITRDWKVLYKKEIGLDYRLDDTHFIEYTEEVFRQEMAQSGLEIETLVIRFGEIWSKSSKIPDQGTASTSFISCRRRFAHASASGRTTRICHRSSYLRWWAIMRHPQSIRPSSRR